MPTLQGIKMGFLGLNQASANQDRRLVNKDFLLPLDGSLKCQPLGGKSPIYLIDSAFIDSQVIAQELPSQRLNFLPSAHHALKAAVKAHGLWPSHMSPVSQPMARDLPPTQPLPRHRFKAMMRKTWRTLRATRLGPGSGGQRLALASAYWPENHPVGSTAAQPGIIASAARCSPKGVRGGS